MTSKRDNPKTPCQDLLLSDVSFSGWLKKQSDGHFKTFHKRYCLLYNGYFFYYDNDNSKTANGCICLAGCKANLVKKSKQGNAFRIEHVGFVQKTFVFAAYSPKELEEWISHITREVSKAFPGSLKLHERGLADGSDSDDNSEYDYTQPQPTDVSFCNPELEDDGEINSTRSKSITRFEGPKLKNQDSNTFKPVLQPTPPPRPPQRPPPVMGDEKKVYKTKGYEVTKIRIPSTNVDLAKDGHTQTDEDESYADMNSGDCDILTPPRPCACPSSIPERVAPVGEATTCCDDHYEDSSNHNADYSDAKILPPSVYQWTLKRDMAEETLRTIGAIGLYLIRKGAEERNVLTVYTAEVTYKARHYIIFQRNGKQFLAQEPEPKFQRIGDLVRYYMRNKLPTCNIKLSHPYRD